VIAVETVEERLRALMIQSLAGDDRAYRILLQESGKRLRAYYLRRLNESSMADDLMQETLIAIHTRRSTYDTDRPFTAWLHAIARYKLIDYVRSHRRQRAVMLEGAPEDSLVFEEVDPATQLDLVQILETVPSSARDLIRAVKIEGRSIAEVSAASGLSESVVKVTIHRALKRLSQAFGGKIEP
jgi:RNA polymerase sigma-70 factor (ECF subfamily)